MADDHNMRGASLLPAGQILGAMIILMGLGFLPPSQGKMFLLPLHARAPVAALAIIGGARIVTSGPVGGSLVVVGERNRLFLPMLKAGILVMAAPVAGCDDRRAAEL
jgi:hypothetical protein